MITTSEPAAVGQGASDEADADMGTTVLHWDEYRSMPWKNGGGTTREVAAGTVGRARTAHAQAGRPAGTFDWRVSVADVEAEGPFSPFQGIDRVITLIEGEGMVLTVDGVSHRLEPLSPHAFSGDATTDCRLPSGPVRDMNVMTRKGRASAEVSVVRVSGARAVECGPHETLLVMAVSEGLALGAPRGGDAVLGRLDCALHEGAGTLDLAGNGTVAVIRIASAS